MYERVEFRTNVEAVAFGKMKDTSSIIRVWKLWREERRRERGREKEETGRFGVAKVGGGGSQLMASIFSWCLRSLELVGSGSEGDVVRASVIIGGKSELTRETKNCLAERNPMCSMFSVFWPPAFVFWLCWTNERYQDLPSGGKSHILDVS